MEPILPEAFPVVPDRHHKRHKIQIVNGIVVGKRAQDGICRHHQIVRACIWHDADEDNFYSRKYRLCFSENSFHSVGYLWRSIARVVGAD